MILSAEIGVHRPDSIGRRAARSGDFDIAAFAMVQKAKDHRERGESLYEVFVLVELASIYQHLRRFNRLPRLARRVREIEGREELSPAQAALVQIAAELIESSPEDPSGLKIFEECWRRDLPL